ncbi:MAG: ATP synthase subunit b [Candidatus Gottesmanbacteria bacterium GW2011_GWB1_43_11]|uniref:ATP synthase subunit b n=1 Tax=Candidatus Gottesmanbacteria bacterium GW2011_GWB1_43_11 TaxID=1618446 RepID=A0A0G1ETG5_9BACT|nr:MAG: ATP synthase subunit b [Candidatus Gottesmanbacteria bacterium GW2011_GWA2_42_16]KKS55808.1 MAG: ATP synthase subunit b [Candidatus Gottesmanbacteria bacterium GW2011_GWA1_42_26]KKS82016.1 MAG: F0F1-type ATP synthase, subunit B, F-type H+-transporting ATPase subunit b [Candidatus Gottesmanbacteria bacterium GW2011_GWC1_43_10]KKS86376.1 MAG: ATP synthase subunit b [Candidatus Gottesmanbacteria bacterium GW2011_GWB1_43_11]OGG07969.1 MAG: ATP synthase F0 subunit B [Candidatus Gottesmanbact
MEKLGVELPLLLTQIVNFTIMLIVLTKFLYKPILKALKDRKRQIEAGLQMGEKAKQEEEKLDLKKQEVLREAREETKVVLENAKKDAMRLHEEIIEKGKREVAEMKRKLVQELEGRQREMEADIKNRTVEISAQMVKRLLGEVLTTADQHKLVEKQLEKIARTHEKKS